VLAVKSRARKPAHRLHELKFETRAMARGASAPDRCGSSAKSKIAEEIFCSTFCKEIARLEKSREQRLRDRAKEFIKLLHHRIRCCARSNIFFARERIGGSCS